MSINESVKFRTVRAESLILNEQPDIWAKICPLEWFESHKGYQ